MRIGIAYLEYSRRGGVERISAELADRIARRGHEVHFHCTRWEDSVTSSVQFHRVQTIDLVNSSKLLSFAVLGKASLNRGHYDITHSYGNVVGCDVITAQSCHRAGLNILRGLRRETIKSRVNFGIADRIRLDIEHKNYAERRYKKVIAVSQGVKRELARYYQVPDQDVVVIPNGVDLNEFNPGLREKFRGSVRERLGLSRDDFVLIFVANEFDRKGLEFIIRALYLLKEGELKVLVLGRDNKIPYLQLATDLGVERQLLFLGSVTDVSAYYAASDVFVFPSFYEAFSVATLEAAASGLPLLVTKVNGTEELVREGYNGFFITRDGKHITECLQGILRNRQKLDELEANARKSAESYSWDIITDKVLSVYEEIRHEKSA